MHLPGYYRCSSCNEIVPRPNIMHCKKYVVFCNLCGSRNYLWADNVSFFRFCRRTSRYIDLTRKKKYKRFKKVTQEKMKRLEYVK